MQTSHNAVCGSLYPAGNCILTHPCISTYDFVRCCALLSECDAIFCDLLVCRDKHTFQKFCSASLRNLGEKFGNSTKTSI